MENYQTSESIVELAKALMVFHREVGKIKKSETNPFFKSKYAALPQILEAIAKPLQESGLSFVQFPTGKNNLTTQLMHTSGEWIRGDYFMQPAKEDPQGYGSCITYQRRYALGAILGLTIDEDDDGNKASNKAAEPAIGNCSTCGAAMKKSKTGNLYCPNVYSKDSNNPHNKPREISKEEKKFADSLPGYEDIPIVK